MRRTLALLALALGAAATAAHAQAPPFRFEGAGRTQVPVSTRRGHPAVPLRGLRALGAEIATTETGARVVLLGDTLRFETSSPFFRTRTGAAKLTRPPYPEGADYYLPRDFYEDWLPRHFRGRLVFENGVLSVATARGAAARPQAEPERPAPPPAARATQRDTSPAPAPAPRVVVIDPGHGGRDPGKVGPNGLAEKQVTLAIARRLASLLESRGYEVHLTRDRDTLIALADRPRLANEWKAGRATTLFLSLHANSGAARARGFETYFLSDARTEDERRVAEMENAAVRFEERTSATSGDALDHILMNLRNDFYMHASNDLAEVVQRRLGAFHPGPDRGVKQAGFRVLVGALMPAVLVEIAFVSNPAEAQLLGTSAFQQKVAWGLLEAVDQFFESHQHVLTTEAGQ